MTLLSAQAIRSDGLRSLEPARPRSARIVVEAETAEAAREKVERKGYIVHEVNRDSSNQQVSF